MSIDEIWTEIQRILKGFDRFLQFPSGCEGSAQVIPDDCVGLSVQRGLVIDDSFIAVPLLRECETEIGLRYPINHRHIQGVLEKSDAVMPVSQLRARKPGAKHQCH